jgi:3-oxoacyl-[acyl-carrier protein] reductase
MNLRGTTVLVTGASGEVGWGIAHAARDGGAHLVLPVRREEARATLAREFPDALVEVADFGDLDSLVRLREAALQRFSSIDHVLSPLGAWWQKGHSLDQSLEELRSLYATYVEAQWLLLKAMAPALRVSGGSFTFITGAAGEAANIPGAGLLVAAVGAQIALSRTLRAELAGEPFRLNEVRIATRIEKSARRGVVPSREAGSRTRTASV